MHNFNLLARHPDRRGSRLLHGGTVRKSSYPSPVRGGE